MKTRSWLKRLKMIYKEMHKVIIQAHSLTIMNQRTQLIRLWKTHRIMSSLIWIKKPWGSRSAKNFMVTFKNMKMLRNWSSSIISVPLIGMMVFWLRLIKAMELEYHCLESWGASSLLKFSMEYFIIWMLWFSIKKR